jgi:hypothetical protein
VTFRSRDRTDTKGEPCSIKRIETEALQRGADDLDVVIPDGATTKQVKQLFKNARYKGNQDRRLACASSPVLLIRLPHHTTRCSARRVWVCRSCRRHDPCASCGPRECATECGCSLAPLGRT